MAPPERALPRLLPKDSTHPQQSSGSSGISDLPPRRVVVRVACENCRKKKIKCNGVQPQCASCESKGLQCVFANKKEPTEALESLQTERDQIAKYRAVVELLHNGGLAESSQIIGIIRGAADLDSAVDSITAAQLLLPNPSSASSTRTRTRERSPAYGSHRPEKRRLLSSDDDPEFMFEKKYMVDPRNQYVNDDIFVDLSTPGLPLSRWTTVSTDDKLMNHLYNMFFTWDHVPARGIYRPILDEDVAGMDPVSSEQPGSFCTPFLVNALLAASCLYTMDPVTFKIGDDSTSRGRLWADEAEKLLQHIAKPSLPLLQGLYCLFAYEGNIGSGAKSVEYFHRAIEVYKRLNEGLARCLEDRSGDKGRDKRERQALSWCMWGFYCCEWMSTQAFGFQKQTRKPQIDRAWREDDFPLSRPDVVGYWWFPYPISAKIQQSMQVQIKEVNVLLSEIAEEVLDILFSKEGDVPPVTNPKRALELYDALVAWKLSLPSRLTLAEAVLPSAVLLHIYQEMLVLSVLRPFSERSKDMFGRFDPRQRCVAHVCSLMSVIWTFRAFAHIRFEYYLVHVLGTAAFIVLKESEDAPTRMDTLVRACQCLHEMGVSLPLAKDVLSGIYAAFKKYKLPIPGYMSRYFDTVHHRRDGLMHYAVTALLPTVDTTEQSHSVTGIQLQELLDELNELDID